MSAESGLRSLLFCLRWLGRNARSHRASTCSTGACIASSGFSRAGYANADHARSGYVRTDRHASWTPNLSARGHTRCSYCSPSHAPNSPVPPSVLVYIPPLALGGPFWRFNLCWWATCDLFFPWTFGYTTVSSPGPTDYVSQVYETPVYVYGYEREDTPQLMKERPRRPFRSKPNAVGSRS